MTTKPAVEAIEASVELEGDDLKVFRGGSGSLSAILGNSVAYWSKIGEELPAWWSPARDAAARLFWKSGDHISGVMFNAQTKLSGIPMKIVARDITIEKHVRQAAEMTDRINMASEFGATLTVARDKFNEDYLGTDNGGFMLLIGDGDKDGFIKGPVHSIRHLDSSRCTRTGDPEFPVLYSSDSGLYKIHWSRVIFMSQMPSAIKTMNGVGFCSVSRSVQVARDLMNVLGYKAEKLGSRPQSQILVGKNISGQSIMKIFMAAEQMMDDLGLRNYAKTVAIGGDEVELNRIVLNDFDPFNEEMSITLGMHTLAMAWGLEFNEMFPQAGSKSSDLVALQRARGKLPIKYTEDLKAQMDLKLVPRHLEVIFDFQDDTLDMQRANINDIRARNRSRNLESGATTRTIERRRMAGDGEMSWSDVDQMQLEDGFLPDGRHIGAAYFDNRYLDVLGDMGQFIDTSRFVAADVIPVITERRVAAYEILGQQSGQAQRRRASEVLAALSWLESQYTIVEDEEEVGIVIPDRNIVTRSKETKQIIGEEFENDIATQIDAAVMSDDPRGELEDLLPLLLLFAFLESSGIDTEDDLSDDQRALIDAEILLFIESLDTIVARAESGIDMLPTVDRLIAQVMRLFNLGLLSGASDDDRFTWRRDPQKDSCSDCLGLDGQTKTAAEWKELAAQGIYPRSFDLACKGFFCGCGLTR